jgi:hypothetical protein
MPKLPGAKTSEPEGKTDTAAGKMQNAKCSQRTEGRGAANNPAPPSMEASMELILIVVVVVLLFGGGGYWGRGRGYW